MPADAELLTAVRAGDTAAFGVLYDRHREAARRLSRVLVRDPSDAEDLVAEAVTKVLAALRGGRGPDLAFRAYLLTAVRNACYDRARRDRRIELTEDLSQYESADGSPGPGAGDPALASLERSYAARAFAKLPDRWRMVLWHTEVEGEKPAAVAVLLGVSPNAVAALAYRARERLRQIYLQEHLTGTADPACHWTAGRLGAHVRGGLAGRESSKVDSHLAGCADCRGLRAELAEVNSGLRGVLGPLVLGTAAAPYLASVPSVAWWAPLAGWGRALLAAVRGWWSSLAGWGRDRVQRYGPGNAAAGIGVAAAALVGVGLFLLALGFGPNGGGEPAGPAGRPPVAAPGPPVPVPAPDPSGAPAPPGGPARSGGPAPGPGPVPAGLAPPEPPRAPEPEPPAPEIAVAPDLSTTSLAAGAPGELAIAVSLPAEPESAPAPAAPTPGPDVLTMEFLPDSPGDTPRELHDQQVQLVVGWPAGVTLTGADAGAGWHCTAVPGGAHCQRPAWPARESRTATLPVAVDGTLGGYAPIEIAVSTGRLRGQAQVRVPVAPAGLRVGYAVTGRYGLAMAGNTWLSCPARPDCLATDPLDNNLVPVAPYRPGPGDPAPPAGLPGDPAASGVALPIPAGARVRWAALHWASTAAQPPDQVWLHGPAGGWQPVRADEIRAGEGAPVRQAYADVTGLVRAAGGGTWWLATGAAGLPTGLGAAAGWSLSLVYAHPDLPRRDLVVFTDPVALTGSRSLSVAAAAPGAGIEVGLVLWEGDRAVTGDSLALDGRPLGRPDNLAASRAAGALECGDTPPDGCGWHTFGVDVASYTGTAGAGPDGGTLLLRTGPDKLQVGVLVLAVPEPR